MKSLAPPPHLSFRVVIMAKTNLPMHCRFCAIGVKVEDRSTKGLLSQAFGAICDFSAGRSSYIAICFLLAVFAILLSTGRAVADDPLPIHPSWGRAEPESWTVLRTETWRPQEGNATEVESVSRTVTETRTLLRAASGSAATLERTVTVEVGGQRFSTPPRETQEDPWGHALPFRARTMRLPPAEWTVGTATIPCEAIMFQYEALNGSVTDLVYYNAEIPPYVFYRKVSRYVPDQSQPVSEAIESVSSLRPALLPVWRISPRFYQLDVFEQTPTTLKRGTRFASYDIPGGVYAESFTEWDSSGEILRETRTRLVDAQYDMGQSGRMESMQSSLDQALGTERRRPFSSHETPLSGPLELSIEIGIDPFLPPSDDSEAPRRSIFHLPSLGDRRRP